jgi:ADP-heptose:LPS heptosyltransferase/GT2 family glycosyltransferase
VSDVGVLPDTFSLIHVETPRPDERLLPGRQLCGSGWVISELEVTQIAVYLGDRFLGYATYGEPTAEVAARFPHYSQSEACGFSFNLALGADVAGSSAWLVVDIQTIDGAHKQKFVPVHVAAAEDSLPTPAVPAVSIAGAIQLSVEHARIDSEGLLRISGWAMALAPLMALDVFLGDELLGTPETGLARPDVALAHPNSEFASSSGFKLVRDVSSLSAQHPVLRVRATAVGGVTRQVIVPVILPERPRASAVDPAGVIDVCVDSVTLRADGYLAADGWAVSVHGITDVAVEIDSAPIGSADFGGPRPDVGNRYPRIMSARRSGFSYRRRLEMALHGEHLLTLRIRDGSGAERVFKLPALVEEASRPTDMSLHVDADDIRLHIDAPQLEGDRAPEPVRGVLTVAGWALSKSDVDGVEVFLDDRSLGSAYVGIRREDIAAAFPDIVGALLSGFAITIPHRMLGVGDRSVRVVVKDKAGRTLERTFALAVAENEESIPSTQLRDRVRQAEVDILLAGLSADSRPVFEIVVRSAGADATSRERLDRTLRSLQNQAYLDWFAVVAPAVAEEPQELAEFLRSDRYGARAHDRIRVQDRGAASIAWHQSHERRFVAALRAGDRLGADALLQCAIALGRDDATDFVYCDDRRMSPASGAVAAFFKPDWSPELLMSTNYLGRSWFARQALLDLMGVTHSELAGSSDFDLALRITEGAQGIRHVARVLLDTEAGGTDSDAVDRHALERNLARRNVMGEASPGRIPSTWRVREFAMTERVSIIIPTRAARGLIRTCLETIRAKTTYQHYELVILDNIPDGLSEDKLWVKRNADKVLCIDEPFNWSRFNNRGAAVADGEFLLFLNDDVEVIDGGWLDAMLALARQPGIGAVGAQLLYPDGKVQHAGMFLDGSHGVHAFRFAQGNDPGYFGLALTQRNVVAVTGACMLSRRAAFDQVGGFNEAHSVVNNDLDYCLKMWRANLRVAYTPFATLIHHELASRATMSDVYDAPAFFAEWGGVIRKGDPFHNPNLATDVVEYAVESESAELVHSGHPVIHGSGVERILVLKLDHLGDFVTALPALRRLKKRFPKATMTVLAASGSLTLAAMESSIDEVIPFDFFHARSGLGRRETTPEEKVELEARLRDRHFDVAIDLRMHPDTRQILQLSGARLLAGFEHGGRFPWLDVALEWEGDNHLAAKRTNVVDRLCQLVEALGVACDEERASLPFMERETAWRALQANPVIAALPETFATRPIVVIHPAVGNDTRQWPEQHFAELIDLLVEEESVNVFLVGARHELPIAERVLDGVHRRAAVVSVLGALTLQELPMLLKAADLFVGNNSGPQHIAAALGTPTIGIHSGVVDATEWAPVGPRALAIRRKTVCSPCYIAAAADCHRQLACLRKLRPSDVYAVCRTMLGHHRRPGEVH